MFPYKFTLFLISFRDDTVCWCLALETLFTSLVNEFKTQLQKDVTTSIDTRDGCILIISSFSIKLSLLLGEGAHGSIAIVKKLGFPPRYKHLSLWPSTPCILGTKAAWFLQAVPNLRFFAFFPDFLFISVFIFPSSKLVDCFPAYLSHQRRLLGSTVLQRNTRDDISNKRIYFSAGRLVTVCARTLPGRFSVMSSCRLPLYVGDVEAQLATVVEAAKSFFDTPRDLLLHPLFLNCGQI